MLFLQYLRQQGGRHDDQETKRQVEILAPMTACIDNNSALQKESSQVIASAIEILRWPVKPSDVLIEVQAMRRELGEMKETKGGKGKG